MAHILIVDDEPMIRFLVRRVLELASHKVSEAHDGRVALDMLQLYAQQFQVIILDLQMPRMSGLEFLASVPDIASYPPIIILTADKSWAQKTAAHKVSGYLTKPFRTRDLIDTVNNQLNKPSGRALS